MFHLQRVIFELGNQGIKDFPRVEMHTGTLLLRPQKANDYNHVQFDGAPSQQHFILTHDDINYKKRISSVLSRLEAFNFAPKFF